MATPESIDSSGVLLIQGDAGTGKTTICEWIAPALGADFFDTGDMWRGMTAYALMEDFDWKFSVDCDELAKIYNFKCDGGRSFVCGIDVTEELRSSPITAAVSQYASVSVLRKAFTRAAREWISSRPAIVSGRHLREIFPEAAVCLHIERELEESKSMREQHAGDGNAHLVQSRREQDVQNAVVAGVDLKMATVLDVTGMSKLEQATAVLELADASGFEVDWSLVGYGYR